jgi:hypothetical protein
VTEESRFDLANRVATELAAKQLCNARLASNGERLLCGQVRLRNARCTVELGTYFGKDGSDAEYWGWEPAGHLRPRARLDPKIPLWETSPSRQRSFDQHRQIERPKVGQTDRRLIKDGPYPINRPAYPFRKGPGGTRALRPVPSH